MDFGIRVIRIMRDVDFFVMGDSDVDDENIMVKMEPRHGTVIYVAGMVEDGDEDELVSMGAADGESEFHIAFEQKFVEFSRGWYELIGKPELCNFDTNVTECHRIF